MSDELFYPGAHAESRPDAIAYRMVGADGTPGAEVTYAELHERANRIAHLFRSLGLHPGDHVAFCLENHPWFLSLAWGAHYAGLYYTAISSRLTAEEIAYIVDDCGARVFITSGYKARKSSFCSKVCLIAARKLWAFSSFSLQIRMAMLGSWTIRWTT